MSTTTSPAPVTPPPRLGATPHTEKPATAQPDSRWATGLRWAGDATSVVLLIAVLWWLAYHDGGWERTALAKVGLLAVFAVPAAAAELRRLPIIIRALIAMWGVGLVASLLFAAERSNFAEPTITYALVPVVGLSAYRVWQRRWGPPAVAGLLLVSFGLYWYQAFMGWWGLATWEGRQPMWRPLSWHNQSGTLMVAFAMFFTGIALNGRKVVAVAFGLSAAGAFAGAWLAGSRGAIVVLTIGIVILAAGAVIARGWTTALWRAAALIVLSALIVGGLLGFAEMQDGGEIEQPVASRSRTESAEDNFFRRFTHMDAAVGMFVDRPVTGQGVGAYRRMALPFTAPDSNLTASAHNEYAEALGEGGLLFAIPFVGLTFTALVIGRKRLRTGRRGLAELSQDIGVEDLRWPLSIGAVGVLVALVVHQGADFDWSYPVLPALLAFSIAIAGHDASTDHVRRPAASLVPTIATSALLVVLLVGGSGAVLWENRSHQQQPDLSAGELARVPVAWDAGHASDVASDLMRGDEYAHARRTLHRAVAWNPGYHPVRVDLAVVDYAADELSGRELVDVLLDGYLDFGSANEVAQALIRGGDHARARTVLRALLEIYPRYESWGIGSSRADTWYLLVQAAAGAEGCEAAEQEAAEARRAPGMDEPQHLQAIDEIVEMTCA